MAGHADAAGRLNKMRLRRLIPRRRRSTASDPAAPHDGVTDKNLDGGDVSAREGEDQSLSSGDAGDSQSEPTRSEVPIAGTPAKRGAPRMSLAAGVLIVAGLSVLAGPLSYQAYVSHQVDQQSRLFLLVARQEALNLTTIDHTRAEADVARILDGSTGTFHDEFQERSQPFIEVVKATQSTSQGSVIDAAVESMQGDEAQILVAVQVKTSAAGAPEDESKGWRMRIHVRKVGDTAKVSDVAFVG